MMELNNNTIELQQMSRKMDDIEKMLKESVEQKKEIREKLQVNKQETKKWSDLFSEKVKTLITGVEKVQRNVIDAKDKIENSDDKLKKFKLSQQLKMQAKAQRFAQSS